MAGEAAEVPLRQTLRAEALVEGDRGRIPVEDVPFEAPAAPGAGQTGHMAQERAADPATAERRRYEEILEMDTGAGEEGGVGREEERETGGLVVPEREDTLRGRRSGGGEERRVLDLAVDVREPRGRG